MPLIAHANAENRVSGFRDMHREILSPQYYHVSTRTAGPPETCVYVRVSHRVSRTAWSLSARPCPIPNSAVRR